MRPTSRRMLATTIALVGAMSLFAGCGDDGSHLPAGMAAASSTAGGTTGISAIDSVIDGDPGPSTAGLTSSVNDPLLDYDGTGTLDDLGTGDPYQRAETEWSETEGSTAAIDSSVDDLDDDGLGYASYGGYGSGYGDGLGYARYGGTGYGYGGNVLAAGFGGFGGAGLMDAGLLDTGVVDDPGLLDAGFDDPGIVDAGFDPGVDPSVGMDAGFVDPGFDAGVADVGFDAGVADPGFDIGAADVGFDPGVGVADVGGFDTGGFDVGAVDVGAVDVGGFDAGIGF